MNVSASLDNRSYSQKPKNEIAGIKCRISNEWTELEIRELADLVGNKGHAIMPGHLIGGNAANNCTEMQIFMLDFDEKCSFSETMQRCIDFKIPISFAYHTYSSCYEQEKFRIAFVNDYVINDPMVLKIIIKMLHKVFPNCDHSCTNLDRLFLGGKELIYCNEDARIDLVQLIIVFYDLLAVNGNFRRNIQTFCSENSLYMINNRAAMGSLDLLQSITENGEKMDSAILHTVGESTKSPFFIIQKDNLHIRSTCKKKLKKISISGSTPCQLLNDFYAGEYLNHSAKFAILTNLLQITGGRKKFFEILRCFYEKETYDKWEKALKYIEGYKPQRCSSEFCAYYSECVNSVTIVSTLSLDRQIRREEEIYYSIDKATVCMKENLAEAFKSQFDGFHLIKAQTALGKTTAYIELIKNNANRKFLVALPTNNLKEQVYKDLVNEIGEQSVYMTSSIHNNAFIPKEIRDEIATVHQNGLHRKAKEIINEYYETTIETEPESKAKINELKKILKGINEIKDERVVVTTHALLLQLPADFLNKYTVIIDEDILYLQIFGRMYSISEECVNELATKGFGIYSYIAQQMMNSDIGKYKKLNEMPSIDELTDEQMEELKSVLNGDNINDLVHAGAFVKKKDFQTGKIQIQYFCPAKMHKMKYIVLSATLNENIYRQYFAKYQLDVYVYKEKKAAYKGNVFQYTYHSLGRNDLANKMQIFFYAKKLLGSGSNEIVTFKNIPNQVNWEDPNSLGLHFGNATGINSLKGKNIAIVGTPYKAEEAYKLIACFLGENVNSKEDIRPKWRRVDYKKSNFLITTYSNPLLREIQLYSLESELEQCIGRARLLRFDCNVYVFSAFPCEQAHLNIKNYLPDDVENTEYSKCRI